MGTNSKPSVEEVVDSWINARIEDWGDFGAYRIKAKARRESLRDLFKDLGSLGYKKSDIPGSQRERVIKFFVCKTSKFRKSWENDVRDDWDLCSTKLAADLNLEEHKIKDYDQVDANVREKIAETKKAAAEEFEDLEPEEFFSIGREIDPLVLENIRKNFKPYQEDEEACRELGIKIRER